MKKISYLTLALCLGCALESFSQYSGKRENLGTAINADGVTDSAPIVSYDGKTMFFKRAAPDVGYDYDIYESTLDANNNWTKARRVDELNNDKISEVNYVFPSGKKMIVSGIFEGQNGLFYATKNDVTGKWGNFELIDLGKSLDAQSDNINISLNTRENVMIVSAGADLYVSFKEGEKWGAMKEIESLNTDKYEYTPFLDYDDKTLYIAGTGYGDNTDEADIWVVQRTDDTWMNWTKPEKAKGNINTKGWDSFFYIAPSKDYVYVYSLTEGGGDILRLKNELPLSVVSVIDPTPQVVENTIPQNVLIEEVEQLVSENEVSPEESSINRTIGDNQQELENVLVYPNPTKGQFNIVLNTSEKEVFSQISILDVNLKNITTIATSQNIYSFDLSAYDNGIYFVSILANGKTTLKKVVLSK